MRDDFAVFILTHGRPHKVKTYNTLKNQGYTGKIYIILDNEDETSPEYIKNYGRENIIILNKSEWAEKTDTADISNDNRAVVFARNACFDIAKRLNLSYFLQLDDDYVGFYNRYEENGKLKTRKINNLDKLFLYMLDFLNDSGALTVALAQGGDFFGGLKNDFWKRKYKRKAMNTFFCDVKKPFKFFGRINEDVNFYTVYGNQGKLILSIADANINQTTTQATKKGMTDIYLEYGTYLKSFYSVIFSPQCVKIAEMGGKYKRIHHTVKWDNCVTQILSDSYKK